jgi:hypothetical protein
LNQLKMVASGDVTGLHPCNTATPTTAEVALLQCSAQYNEGLAGYGSTEY